MADLVARREARMRRILENSENRLKRITGVENKSATDIDGIKAKESFCVGDTVLNGSSHTIVTNSPSPRLEPPPISPVYDHIGQLENDEEFIEDIQLPATVNLTPAEETNATNANNEKRRYLIIFALALLLNSVLSLLDRVPNLHREDMQLNFIFAPLIMFELYENMFKDDRNRNNNSVMMNYVRLLVQSRSETLAKALEIVRRFSLIMQDVFVYFFAFVCSDFLVNLGQSIVN